MFEDLKSRHELKTLMKRNNLQVKSTDTISVLRQKLEKKFLDDGMIPDLMIFNVEIDLDKQGGEGMTGDTSDY